MRTNVFGSNAQRVPPPEPPENKFWVRLLGTLIIALALGAFMTTVEMLRRHYWGE